MHCRVAAQRAGASWRAQAPFGSWLLQTPSSELLPHFAYRPFLPLIPKLQSTAAIVLVLPFFIVQRVPRRRRANLRHPVDAWPQILQVTHLGIVPIHRHDQQLQ